MPVLWTPHLLIILFLLIFINSPDFLDKGRDKWRIDENFSPLL